MSTYSIHEVLEYGPICASNDEFDVLVTVNGAYLNLWCGDHSGNYTNTDCRAMTKDLYNTTGAEMKDLAKRYLEEALNPEEEVES